MSSAPSIPDLPLVPPFLYRLRIPVLRFTPTKSHTWQRTFGYRLRIHNMRLIIAARLYNDDFLAAKPTQETLKFIQSITSSLNIWESHCFHNALDTNEYRAEVLDVIATTRRINVKPIRAKRLPSLTELSFRAVWRKMKVEEQNEFSFLSANSTDVVRDLRRFLSQKTSRRQHFERDSQEENPEPAS